MCERCHKEARFDGAAFIIRVQQAFDRTQKVEERDAFTRERAIVTSVL